jgi:riboflavin synthase
VFTGLVEEIGRVTDVTHAGRHARISFTCATVLEDADLGASVAVDGCCLTVATFTDGGFAADLMAETLRATTLGELEAGSRVNLERAMAAGERFGGHLVQGHVDGVGEVSDRHDEPGTTWLTVTAPTHLAPYLAPKGSVAVDGVSLTVVDVTDITEGARFTVGLIPHTCEVTTLGELRVGDRVNLEADIVAKYLERLGAVRPPDDRAAAWTATDRPDDAAEARTAYPRDADA